MSDLELQFCEMDCKRELASALQQATIQNKEHNKIQIVNYQHCLQKCLVKYQKTVQLPKRDIDPDIPR